MVYIKKILYATIGTIILAAGLYYFLMPSDLAVGGLTGFAMVLNDWFSLPVSIIMLIGNVILLSAGFLLIGREFGGLTIFCSFFLSFVLYIYETLLPVHQPIVDDLMINLLFGILISGVGMGLVFHQNASTGGTDILAKIINKYTGMDIGKALLTSDFIVTLLAGLTFGIKIGMYALLGIIINAMVIDTMIAGFNKKVSVMIHTKEVDLINDYINHTIKRGTTIYYTQGGYRKNDKKIINTIVNPREYLKIKNYATSIDGRVFISSNLVGEVHGEGFTY